MKTAELKGNALDWAVAKAKGITVYPSKQGKKWLSKRWMTADYGEFNHRHGTPWWNPSTDWAQGGPIIERERIELVAVELGEEWIARDYWKEFDEQSGPTPLVAAMRCYVASKLGDEVEIPAELTEAA